MIFLEPAAGAGAPPGASYCGSPAWSALCREIYGYALKDFLIKRESAVIGGFCCAVVPSFIFGTRLISMPFSDEPGLWLAPGITLTAEEGAQLRDALAAALRVLASDTGARHAELRGPDDFFSGETPDARFLRAAPYLRLVLNTSLPYETLRTGFHINLIKNLRKADKFVTVEETRDPAAFAPVYGIYLRQMRLFGSPPLPAAHFEHLLRAGLGRLFTASVAGKPAALLFALEHGRTFFADVNAGLPEFDAFFPKIKLFDATIRRACAGGLEAYDFMRTRAGSGVYEHKKKWGGREIPINYYFSLYTPAARPALDPEEARFRLPRAMLKLAPLRLLAAAGPLLRRHAGK
jgi:hypothetical protein